MLKGMQVLHEVFPAEAPHLSTSATMAQEVDRLIAQLATLPLVYASAGTLQFIDWDHAIVGDALGLALRRNLHLAEQMGKQPFVVADSPGFVVNRVLMPLINEAIFALQEGVADLNVETMFILAERKEQIDFAEPYWGSATLIFLSKDNDSIKKTSDLDA